MVFGLGILLFPSISLALTPDDEALVGVWLFDEGTGDEIADLKNGNVGIMSDAEAFEWDAGKFGQAVVASGGESIDVEDSDSLASIVEQLTVAAWFRVDTDSDTGIRKDGAFLLEDQSAVEPVPDGFSFRIWTTQGLSPGFYGQTELNQGEWYHVAGTYDGETMELYINGEPESTLGALSDVAAEWDPVWGGELNPGSTLQLKFGPEPYYGAIDEVVILNRALSGDEVKQLMAGWANLGGTAGDLDNDGDIDAADIDALTTAIVGNQTDTKFDLSGDGKVTRDDHGFLVTGILKTWIGDADLNKEFNSSDFVSVFQSGKYETGAAAGWSQGDWNADGFFNSSDFVAAFQDGGYEKGPRPAVANVPEPCVWWLIIPGLSAIICRARRRGARS
jgi:hypothetical protein